jgi:glycosyltransferase involved in cell wall biosynthesis
MSANRQLLLVTNDYPYPAGEQFLETEIEILRRHFATIHVVPVNHAHRRTKPPARPVPPEVRIVDLGPIPGRRAVWSCLPQGSHVLARTFQASRHAGLHRPRTLLSILATVIRRCDTARRIVRSGLLDASHAVYSYWANATAFLLAELRAAAGPRTGDRPFVTRAHGHDLWAERSGLERLPFQLAVIESCDRICPCSDLGAAYLRRRYPDYAPKIQRYHLGAAPQPTIAAASSDGVLRLLTCSQLVPVKRLPLLAEALSLLHRPARWTHLGDGPEGPRLKEQCARLGLESKVEFIGEVSNAAVKAYYQTYPIDLFVNTSASEGIPVSIMEALSFGVPVLATAVGGVAELVQPEVGCLLPPEFRQEDLAARLEQHASQSYDRSRIQQWQQRAFSSANYEAFAAQVLCLCPPA